MASVLAAVDYLLLFAGLAVLPEDSSFDQSVPLALGLLLVPAIYGALAFISRHRSAPIAVLKSMGVWLLTTLTFGLASVPVALAFGLSVGGIFSLRAEEHELYRYRFAAAAIYALIVTVLFISPPLAFLAIVTLPFASLAYADRFADRLRLHADE